MPYAVERFDILGNGEALAVVHADFAYILDHYVLRRFDLNSENELYEQHSIGAMSRPIITSRRTTLNIEILCAGEVRVIPIEDMDNFLLKHASVLKLMKEVNKKLTERMKK